MYRGTTPTLELRLKTLIDFNEIDKVYITLASMLNELTISEERCTFDNENKTIQFTLTQEETLSFNVSTVEIPEDKQSVSYKMYHEKIQGE